MRGITRQGDDFLHIYEVLSQTGETVTIDNSQLFRLGDMVEEELKDFTEAQNFVESLLSYYTTLEIRAKYHMDDVEAEYYTSLKTESKQKVYGRELLGAKATEEPADKFCITVARSMPRYREARESYLLLAECVSRLRGTLNILDNNREAARTMNANNRRIAGG